ncbi:MAG: hypothetical protein QOG03_2677 [Actinomycetota bacterium]|jgi:hypothetical protein|nr:hypothetical protein [Actinomycetota bacterium]
MARSKDTYTAAQASQILGVSERRVRQLVNEGKLPGDRGNDGIVHIPQQAVNDERKRRKTTTKAAPATAGAAGRRSRSASTTSAEDVETLANAVAAKVGQRLEGQLEITRKAESLLRDELDEERALRTQAEAKLAQTERRLAELEAAGKKRKIFGRR